MSSYGVLIKQAARSTQLRPVTTFNKFKPFKSFKTIAGLFDGLNSTQSINLVLFV